MRTNKTILFLQFVHCTLLSLMFISCTSISDKVNNMPNMDRVTNEDEAVTNQLHENNISNGDKDISTSFDTVHLLFNTGMTLFWQKQKDWSKPRVLLGSISNNSIDSIYYLNDTTLVNSFKVFLRGSIYTNFYKNNLDDITTAFIYFLIIDKKERTIGYYFDTLHKRNPSPFPEYDAIMEQTLIECIKQRRNEILRKTPTKYRYYYIYNAIQLLG